MRLDEAVSIGEIFEIEAGELRVHTKLQEIMEDGEFSVLQPTVKGVPVRTKDGMVRFSFFRPNGVFVFDAQTVLSYTKGNLRLCRYRQVSDISKVQRRQSYRLPIVLDVTLRDLSDEKEQKLYKGKTVTLSEKSVHLSCFTSLPEETPVSVKIPLSGNDFITIHGKVLKCMEPKTKSEPYELVVLFMEPGRYRTRLSRFIFRQQVIARNKKQDEQS